MANPLRQRGGLLLNVTVSFPIFDLAAAHIVVAGLRPTSGNLCQSMSRPQQRNKAASEKPNLFGERRCTTRDLLGVLADPAPRRLEETCALLVLCPINSFTQGSEFLEDGISGGGPGKGAFVGVVVADKLIDVFHQLAHAAKGSAADGALGDKREPALDLIEPTGVGRGVVEMVRGWRTSQALTRACLWVP